MNRYPKATWKGRAHTYGPLPDGHPTTSIRMVFHSTETAVDVFDRPADQANCPHFVYDPANRTMAQDADLNRRVGTLISSRATGVDGNELSVQIEIVAFANRDLARQRGGIWVGDFTEDHYRDLADLCAWVATIYPSVLDGVYGPADDFASWAYGLHAQHRLTPTSWLNFTGITGHGAVPGNTHWDTGVLDLHRIHRYATEGNTDMAPPMSEWNVIFNDAPIGGDPDGIVEWFEAGLTKLGYGGFAVDGRKWVTTENAVKDFKREYLGIEDPSPKMGGRAYAKFLELLADPPPPPSADLGARVAELEAELAAEKAKMAQAIAILGQ